MANRPFAWSYSALNQFETCPRQYYELKVLKGKWPDPPGEVQLWGQQCHQLIEYRLAMGKPMPDYLNHIEPIIKKLETTKGVTHAEYKLALNAEFKPVEFFAKDAWVRAVGDVVKIHEDKAFQLDWKFGAFREGDAQLKLQSAVSFATYPHVNVISNVYAWVKAKKTTVRTFKREDVPAIWSEFLPRVKRMEIAIANKDFPPSPSGLCARFCAVLSCEHNGRR